MTTINNLTIEQMKEIVEGAPEGASHIRRGIYFKYRNPVEWYYWEENQWKFTSSDITKSVFLIDLNDLRTAIAEYSPDSYGWVGVHYKLGDHIVYKKPWVGNNLVLKIGGDGNQSMSLASASLRQNYIRHATPEEIKAGHRLEAERHG